MAGLSNFLSMITIILPPFLFAPQIHDTAITEKYKIILHFPLCFDPQVSASHPHTAWLWLG